MTALSETTDMMDARTTPPRSRSLLKIYLVEAKYEFLKLVRLPAFAIPTILFPSVFYVFFALAMGSKSGGAFHAATYMLATYGTFGVVGAALFGFGVGVATERGQGWLEVKRATPMPPGAYFAGKIAMSSLFSTAIVGILFILGATLGHVSFPFATWARLYATLIVGSIPFCAMGLAIGYFAGPNSAPAIVNLVYLPMAFASGLWIPIEFLPKIMKSIAPWLPPYHLAQLALGGIGAGLGQPVIGHILALMGFTAVFLVLAAIGYRRDEGKTYG